MAESIKEKRLRQMAVAFSSHELNQRYGAANAEFLKGFRGVDNEAGVILDRSLKKISQYKVNPNDLERNIKQQAGFSAEVASVSQRNAESIIGGNSARSIRSEDLSQFGKNHTVVDIVELIDGSVVATEQMKFVNDYQNLLKKVARGEGGGKTDLSRYMEVDRLSLPTEQVEKAKAYCREQSEELRKQAQAAEEQGKTQIAEKLKADAENFQRLEGKVVDSGLTTEEAIKYRTNPAWETTKDIASVSHRAGMEGAKFGAAIGGCISIVTNIIAYRAGEKDFQEAAINFVVDTGKSAGLGYATGFVGSAVKGFMQQSTSVYTRSLSGTTLPSLLVQSCLSLGPLLTAYAQGEVDESELLFQVGNTTNGLVASSMFSAIGQVAIPVPVVGAMIGGMVGYTLSNLFYHALFDALNKAKQSADEYLIVKAKCEAAIELSQQYKVALEALFNQKLTKFEEHHQQLLAYLSILDAAEDSEQLAAKINEFGFFLGKKLEFSTINEFCQFMATDETLKL